MLLNDVDFLAASVGRAQWLDARMWNMAKTPCRLEHLPLLAQSLLDTMFAALGHVREMRGPRPRQHALGRRDRRRRSRGHRAWRVRRGRGVRRLPDLHSRTQAARDHSRRGQQERARRRRPAVSRASSHGAQGRGYFRLRRQLGQQGRQYPPDPEDAEHRLRFACLSRRQSVRAQHRARVPARGRHARPARGPVALS